MKNNIVIQVEDIKNILNGSKAEMCLKILADRIIKMMRINKSEHIAFFYKKKEKVMTDRQVLCIINATEAAVNNRPEELRRELLDIFEGRQGKLKLSELQVLYIILCIWKKEIL